MSRFDEARAARHASVADRRAHLVEVAPVPGREVVEADHVLAEPQQRLEQMRADEAGAARDEPAPGLRAQPLASVASNRLAGSGRRHHSRQTVDAARAQRRGVRLALHVDVQPVRPPASPTIVVERARANSRCATAATMASARGSSSHGSARRRTRAAPPPDRQPGRGRARRRRTTASSRMTSITRELRRSGQFSLNVRPEHDHVRTLDVAARLRSSA